MGVEAESASTAYFGAVASVPPIEPASTAPAHAKLAATASDLIGKFFIEKLSEGLLKHKADRPWTISRVAPRLSYIIYAKSVNTLKTKKADPDAKPACA